VPDATVKGKVWVTPVDVPNCRWPNPTTKLACTVAGPEDNVTVVEAALALPNVAEPEVTLQLSKAYPALAVAVRVVGVPEVKYVPEAGVTVPSPAGETAVVNWYCVLKSAV
jgi:hypothetical protein